MAGVLLLEIGLGFTGFHAGFREPLIMAVLAFLERFDRRNVRHWVSLGVLCVGMARAGRHVDQHPRQLPRAVSGRRGVRAEPRRAVRQHHGGGQTVGGAGQGQFYGNIDVFIDRLWAIYYPALAVARVPDVVPHTDGKLMLDTLQFMFMPRVFFPDKPEIGSDSELVRRYSGVWVAGANEDTDIAFGYAAESYIDFGVPMMFMPVFIWAHVHGDLLCRHVQVLPASRHRRVGHDGDLLAHACTCSNGRGRRRSGWAARS